MFIVLTRTWHESFYHCHETREKAEEEFKRNSHWWPDCWLIEGTVLKEKRYVKEFEGKVP